MVGDFRYFDTIFKVGKDYSGVINIQPLEKGMLLKDITQIKNISQDVSSSYGNTPKSTFLRDVSMDRVAQPNAKCKPQKGERRDSHKRGDMAQREAQLLRENDLLRRSDPAGKVDRRICAGRHRSCLFFC